MKERKTEGRREHARRRNGREKDMPEGRKQAREEEKKKRCKEI